MKKVFIGIIVLVNILLTSACSGPKEVEDSPISIEYNGESYNGVFTGTTIKGIPNGQGEFKLLNEDEDVVFNYTGNWENGVMVKDGNLEYSKMEFQYNDVNYKGTYTGEVLDGVPNGKGKFKSESNNEIIEYSGEWSDGKFGQSGELYTNNYVVHFKDGLDRRGTYQGKVIDGIASGEGKFSAVNDDDINYSYTGEWEKGLFDGLGKVTYDSDKIDNLVGNFTEGEFTPTPAQYYFTMGLEKDSKYTISKSAIKFLENNPEVFLTHEVDINKIEIDNQFQYKEFTKNQDKFGDKLITIKNLDVIQIFESEYYGAEHTYCLLEDSQYNLYFVYMYGYADGVYEGSRVSLTALPMSYFTYETIEHNSAWAIACAGVILE